MRGSSITMIFDRLLLRTAGRFCVDVDALRLAGAVVAAVAGVGAIAGVGAAVAAGAVTVPVVEEPAALGGSTLGGEDMLDLAWLELMTLGNPLLKLLARGNSQMNAPARHESQPT